MGKAAADAAFVACFLSHQDTIILLSKRCVLAYIVLFDKTCDTAVDCTHMHVQQLACESHMQWINKCVCKIVYCMSRKIPVSVIYSCHISSLEENYVRVSIFNGSISK